MGVLDVVARADARDRVAVLMAVPTGVGVQTLGFFTSACERCCAGEAAWVGSISSSEPAQPARPGPLPDRGR